MTENGPELLSLFPSDDLADCLRRVQGNDLTELFHYFANNWPKTSG